MILSFIISTSLFFLSLILVSARSMWTRRPAGRLLFSMEAGMAEEGGGPTEEAAASNRDERADREGHEDETQEDEYKENIYKGILWMKEKYEQYRDLADERYDRLKEQLLKVEKKYEDLLAGRGSGSVVEKALAAPSGVRPDVESGTERNLESRMRPDVGSGVGSAIGSGAGPDDGSDVVPIVKIVESAVDHDIQARVQELEEQFARERQRLEEEIARLRHQLDEEVIRSRRQLEDQSAEARRQLELHMQHSNRQLEEKQRVIVELEGQLRSDRQKIEELVAKLRHNGQLLLTIYQELDKSLHVTDNPGPVG